MNYVIYNSLGVILRSIDCSPELAAVQIGTGEEILEGYGIDATHYVDTFTHTIEEKTVNPCVIDKTVIIADETDIVTISSLVNPSWVTIGNTMYTVTDGILEISTDLPGTYSILIQAVDYLDKIFTVTVNPS